MTAELLETGLQYSCCLILNYMNPRSHSEEAIHAGDTAHDRKILIQPQT